MKNTVSVRLVSRIIAFALIAVLQVPHALIYNQAHAKELETSTSVPPATETQSETTDPTTFLDQTVLPPDSTIEEVVDPTPLTLPEPEPEVQADPLPSGNPVSQPEQPKT